VLILSIVWSTTVMTAISIVSMVMAMVSSMPTVVVKAPLAMIEPIGRKAKAMAILIIAPLLRETTILICTILLVVDWF
jgi:hypothetical protein